jgi:hypothetical protein
LCPANTNRHGGNTIKTTDKKNSGLRSGINVALYECVTSELRPMYSQNCKFKIRNYSAIPQISQCQNWYWFVRWRNVVESSIHYRIYKNKKNTSIQSIMSQMNPKYRVFHNECPNCKTFIFL